MASLRHIASAALAVVFCVCIQATPRRASSPAVPVSPSVSGSCALSATSPSSSVSADSTALMAKLDEYLAHIDHLSIPKAEAEVDLLIAAVPEDSLRNVVATRAYRHFRRSKLMGSENVAIHIYDTWFATFKAVFPEIEELDEAELYALLNRSSLIGAKARPLTLPTERGDSLTVPKPDKKRLHILYFYSTSCPKCLYYSHQLTALLSSKGSKDSNASRVSNASKGSNASRASNASKGSNASRVANASKPSNAHPRLNFYAVYTGDDAQAWKTYVTRELKVANTCRTKVYHLRGGDANYPFDYGVIQTPRLFLIDSRGVIVGRDLDVPALEKLLEMY